MGYKVSDSRLYAMCGILAVIIMSVEVIVGIQLDPSWDSKTSVICDLGVSDDKAIATSFVVSCCISGLLFVASSGMWLLKESKLLKLTGVFVILAGISLMGVGIVDKTTDSIHQLVVAIYAALFIVGILFACIKDIIDHHWPLVIGFGILAIYSVISFSDMFPYLLTQFLLMGYVFIWYLLKCIGEFDPSSEPLRKIIGID